MIIENPYFFHAIAVNDELCVGCSHCMNACPTEAIRIWNGKACIDENKCVDCGQCYKVCPVNAIYIKQDNIEIIEKYKYRVALFPSVFIGQFGDDITEPQIFQAMAQIGFTHFFEVEQAVKILNKKIVKYQKQTGNELPVISSFCPAIVRLIQVKFPLLADNILKLSTPSDIAAAYLKKKLTITGIPESDIGIFYITPCAAKIAAIKCPVGETGSLVNGVFNVNTIYNKVYRIIKQGLPKTDNTPLTQNIKNYEIQWTLTRGESSRVKGRTLAIDGIFDVMEFLEMVENEEVGHIDYLECRACKESCAGGILNPQNRFLTVERLKKRIETLKTKPNNTNTDIGKYAGYLNKCMVTGKIEPRPMMMLDVDMAKAMTKMNLANRIESKLPGIDCGACGAPSCRALAEDIVKDNATLSHCVFMQKVLVKNGDIDMNTAFSIIDKIWGDKVVKCVLPPKQRNT